jgi:hypothetical protein
MQLIRTRFLALLVATFVALPAQAFASASYLCHMTGEVTGRHCCTGEHKDPPCSPQLQQRDCCELIQAHEHASAPATRASAQEVPAAALIGVIALALLAHGDHEQADVPTTAETHPPGPPRFLAHCSFLI